MPERPTPPPAPAVVACDVPAQSALPRGVVEDAWFRDAYRAPRTRASAGVVDIFWAIFGHYPAWMKAALLLRNSLASWCGLDVPSAQQVLRPEVRPRYAVGDTIGVWPIFHLSDSELIAGRDNKHLDFRLSVLKQADDGTGSVVVSTVCQVHNLFGKLYLFFVVPFHRWGMQRLMRRAVAAGRL